jgi:predicted nucleic acid-binding protein
VPYILDASIAACWYFGDEYDPRADKALQLLADDSALAPYHWWFEIRNVVVLGERRGRVSEQYTADFLQRLEMYPIELAMLPDGNTIFNLARQHSLTFYDAAYLELALRERLPLATLDKALIAAARAQRVSLIE